MREVRGTAEFAVCVRPREEILVVASEEDRFQGSDSRRLVRGIVDGFDAVEDVPELLSIEDGRPADQRGVREAEIIEFFRVEVPI